MPASLEQMNASMRTWRRGCELRWKRRALVARRRRGRREPRALAVRRGTCEAVGPRKRMRIRGSRP
eukprot:8835858-Alexandrium_andersonii.AAC.1